MKSSTTASAAPSTYTSPLPYEESRIHAAALYCSDGRVGEHFDDFLQNGLSLPRYDRLAMPGGPACLADHAETKAPEQQALTELRFLIEAHELSRIVLIQHDGCAFYRVRLRTAGASAEQLQKADLVRAAYHIRDATGMERIDAFFARRSPEGLTFEPVEIA